MKNIEMGKSGESPDKKGLELDVLPVYKLAKPIFVVLEKIKSRIENGEYSIIIGDDSSGRIPTYIVRRVIEEKYKKIGKEKPRTIFITGISFGDYDAEERLIKRERVEFIKNNIRKFAGDRLFGRALIVTEYIQTGASVSAVAAALKEMGIEFDVISLNYMSERSLKYAEMSLGINIITSGETGIPDIYGRYDIAGVDKSDFSTVGRAHAVRMKDKKGKLISTKARKAADEVVEHILEDF